MIPDVLAYVDWSLTSGSGTQVYCDGMLTVVLGADASEIVETVAHVLREAGATEVFVDETGVGHIMSSMLRDQGIDTQHLEVRTARSVRSA